MAASPDISLARCRLTPPEQGCWLLQRCAARMCVLQHTCRFTATLHRQGGHGRQGGADRGRADAAEPSRWPPQHAQRWHAHQWQPAHCRGGAARQLQPPAAGGTGCVAAVHSKVAYRQNAPRSPAGLAMRWHCSTRGLRDKRYLRERRESHKRPCRAPGANMPSCTSGSGSHCTLLEPMPRPCCPCACARTAQFKPITGSHREWHR